MESLIQSDPRRTGEGMDNPPICRQGALRGVAVDLGHYLIFWLLIIYFNERYIGLHIDVGSS
ncbi:MAG: hypothetical protein AB2557_08940, partial [Candidatus Thiodiazotropha sp.]